MLKGSMVRLLEDFTILMYRKPAKSVLLKNTSIWRFVRGACNLKTRHKSYLVKGAEEADFLRPQRESRPRGTQIFQEENKTDTKIQ